MSTNWLCSLGLACACASLSVGACGGADEPAGRTEDSVSTAAPDAPQKPLDAGAKPGSARLDAGQRPSPAADPSKGAAATPSSSETSSATTSETERLPATQAADAAVAQGTAPPSDDGMKCYPLLAHDGDFATPYKLGVAKDAYTAFTFKAPWKDTEYAVLMRPVIDNMQVVHHWLLFQDLKPGTPGPGVVENGTHPDSTLMAAWLPGTDPMDLRAADLGLELPSTSTYTLEIHYNSKDETARDRSGVEVCTYPKKPKNVGSYTWVGYEQLAFPAKEWTGVCKPKSQEPIHIYSIVPHMHLKGIHFKATINRNDGTKEVFHDAPFDFAYERMFIVNLTLQPGETITTNCTYSEPKSYGPRVDDEMCYMFTMAYPKGALSSDDFVGSALHGAGSTCLGQ